MELKPQWRAMMESRYSKVSQTSSVPFVIDAQFLMAKLIRYCPSIREPLILAIQPHVTQILLHADAVKPLSDLYDLYSTARERNLLMQGFYPKEVGIFDKAAGSKRLEEILDGLGSGQERVIEGIEKAVLNV